jgi:hypothetical protein
MYIPINFKSKSNILIAGAGGGFDFLCGLPLAHELKAQGHNIIFSNYSFTDLESVNCEKAAAELYEITSASSLTNGTYFPEGLFAKWYRSECKEEISVYCYRNIGVLPLINCFNIIQDLHEIDAVIVIDGGVDGIFRGDEYDLGTPTMDSISMIAANESGIKEKFYVMTAFGSEGVGQEISHAEVLQRISELTKNNAYYGVTALLKNDDAAHSLINASRSIFNKMPEYQHSNIVCSILKALDGEFGFCAVNAKTELNPIWVSPLTSMYWFFDLDKTAKMKLYYEAALKTSAVHELSEIINAQRKNSVKIKMGIPI